jgi:hypothetical protein
MKKEKTIAFRFMLFFRGLQKNKTELLPLNTTTITNNPGLTGEQHPLY